MDVARLLPGFLDEDDRFNFLGIGFILSDFFPRAHEGLYSEPETAATRLSRHWASISAIGLRAYI